MVALSHANQIGSMRTVHLHVFGHLRAPGEILERYLQRPHSIRLSMQWRNPIQSHKGSLVPEIRS